MLEALTHKSGKEALGLESCYEKLEVLGDSILDYLCNYSLIKYTIYDKYLDDDLAHYKQQEDFTPADAHQAKSMLVKNELIGKLTVLLGLHKYIIYQES